jgi:D-aminopeptidase
MLKEFGGQGIETNFDPSKLITTKASLGSATTIGIIATNVALDKAGATRMASAAHDGFARAIYSSHTPMDGDLIFGVSTGQREMKNPTSDPVKLGNAGAICMTRAIARAVFEAQSAVGDTDPTWKKNISLNNWDYIKKILKRFKLE